MKQEIGTFCIVGPTGPTELYYSLTRTRAHKVIITFTRSSRSKARVLLVFLNKIKLLRWTGCRISPGPGVFSA
jgi:hypothetical protein